MKEDMNTARGAVKKRRQWLSDLEEQVWVEEQEMCFPVGVLLCQTLLLLLLKKL